MNKYIVEYIAYYSDGINDYEQIINFEAKDDIEAKIEGRRLVMLLDDRYQYNKVVKICLEDDFKYSSSFRNPQLNGFK